MKFEFLLKAHKHNLDSWMRNKIKKTPLSIYSQSHQKQKKKKWDSDFNDICVYKYKAILNKTQMGMYQKQLKTQVNPQPRKKNNSSNKSFSRNLSSNI